MAPSKQVMVASRLAKRLHYYELSTYEEYFKLVTEHKGHEDEFQVLVNILTTNETYFFREPKHFDFLREQVLKSWRGTDFKVWSAASSSGEEAYTLAMVLAETLRSRQWEVFGSDISTRVLDIANSGIYMMDRLENMDKALLNKYCLRGVRSLEGFLRISDELKQRTRFAQMNLMQPLPKSMLAHYDVVFLRNVLIYFDASTKKSVVERVISALKPGGYFFISHSESLHRITDQLEMIKPSIFIKR